MVDKFSKFAELTYKNKYAHVLEDGTKENWTQIAWRVATKVFSAVDTPKNLVTSVAEAIEARKTIPGGRYLYSTGRPVHQTNNCLLLKAEDSREGWADLLHKAAMSLMTGAGIGVVYSGIREEGAFVNSTGEQATGPLALMQMLNEVGRGIEQGGSLRSALWAGMHWNHPDIDKFMRFKNWSEDIRARKRLDHTSPAPMDMTNISIILDDAFFEAYEKQDPLAHRVYWNAVKFMLKTSEPGFTVDVGENAGEHLRNACTEVCSYDDSDVCNLISPNMSRVEDEAEMLKLTRLSTAFAVAGSVYSDLPYEKVEEIREKNRRLGVGLMGLHEWLLQRGKTYDPDEELEQYLKIYERATTQAASDWAFAWGLSTPVKTRAIAPNGTIGIVAGPTTTGIEPMFCVAYKRYFTKGKTREFEYIIEPIAQRLIDQGTAPEDIEDAYSISVERRLEFQAWVQQYVDHGISSTINLPAWGSEKNNKSTVQEYGNLFLKYLPRLRGLTCYANGSRDGQPIVPVSYEEALAHQAKEDTVDICEISGKGGSCGL